MWAKDPGGIIQSYPIFVLLADSPLGASPQDVMGATKGPVGTFSEQHNIVGVALPRS